MRGPRQLIAVLNQNKQKSGISLWFTFKLSKEIKEQKSAKTEDRFLFVLIQNGF